MDNNQELGEEFLRELTRVLGPADGTVFYSIGTDGEHVGENLERLREMPTGIGYHELLRRLGFTPPDELPGPSSHVP